MPTCFVVGCRSSSKRKKAGVTFHRISRTLHLEWLSAIGRDPDVFIAHQVVCSEHFKADDFDQNGQRRTIKPHVIPTMNLPNLKLKRIFRSPRTSGEPGKQSSILLKPPIATTESIQMGMKTQTNQLEIFFQDVEASMPKLLHVTNSDSEEISSNPLIFLMSSNSSTKLANNGNIVLDFRDSTEILRSDSCSPIENENNSMYQVSSAFHSYSQTFNQEECLKQIKKTQHRGNYFIQKYQKVQRINIRRKKKIIILNQILRNLKKKLKTVK